MKTAFQTYYKNAYAKINLTLEVLAKKENGYHDIRSIMHKVTLCDKLEFCAREDSIITLWCDKEVCAMEDNLAYKAAVLFSEKYKELTGNSFGVDIRLYKNIPDKAGLAGGSADCACVLDALYEIYGVLDYSHLEDIAASLGSDINFCLDKYKCAYASGRGVQLECVSCLPKKHLVICVPDFAVKTSEAYSDIDKNPSLLPYNCTEVVKKILNKELDGNIADHVFNSFSRVCESKCSDITDIKSALVAFGAQYSEMSGSGSSVFGVFDDEKNAEYAACELKKKYTKTFLCESISE